MDTMSEFTKGRANINNAVKVFDWDKAAKLIKENSALKASAGLSGDWEWTGGDILIDGKIPESSYTYLASTWATPEIDINGNITDCYKMQSAVPDWDASTFWPKSARDIFKSKKLLLKP